MDITIDFTKNTKSQTNISTALTALELNMSVIPKLQAKVDAEDLGKLIAIEEAALHKTSNFGLTSS